MSRIVAGFSLGSAFFFGIEAFFRNEPAYWLLSVCFLLIAMALNSDA